MMNFGTSRVICPLNPLGETAVPQDDVEEISIPQAGIVHPIPGMKAYPIEKDLQKYYDRLEQGRKARLQNEELRAQRILKDPYSAEYKRVKKIMENPPRGAYQGDRIGNVSYEHPKLYAMDRNGKNKIEPVKQDIFNVETAESIRDQTLDAMSISRLGISSRSDANRKGVPTRAGLQGEKGGPFHRISSDDRNAFVPERLPAIVVDLNNLPKNRGEQLETGLSMRKQFGGRRAKSVFLHERPPPTAITADPLNRPMRPDAIRVSKIPLILTVEHDTANASISQPIKAPRPKQVQLNQKTNDTIVLPSFAVSQKDMPKNVFAGRPLFGLQISAFDKSIRSLTPSKNARICFVKTC